jgi:rhomboid protease GluP
MHMRTSDALAFGASYSLAVVGENRWETLLTACFLHDGLLHIGFNMLALWMAGPLVERSVGSARMAPMYLLAGVCGNLLSLAYSWHTGGMTLGASGSISGVLAAALVVGWRVQGWRGPVTQATARWLGFVFAFGLLSSRFGRANIDNAAHLGGALAGGASALTWRPKAHEGGAALRDEVRASVRASKRGEALVLGVCAAVLAICVALVGIHDHSDPFATMTLQDRQDFTSEAVADGRCRDAQSGLRAVERLRERLASVASLRGWVEATCGHTR